jgi:hypothetical protein
MLNTNIESSILSDDVAANGTIINSPKGYEVPSITQPKGEPNRTNVLTGDVLGSRELPPQLPPVEGNDKKQGGFSRVLSFIRKPFCHDQPPAPPNSAVQAIPKPNQLLNPRREDYSNANQHLVSIWSKGGASPEEAALLPLIAKILSDSFHVSVNQTFVSKDFDEMVNTIRRLRGKVGLSELAVMILLALIIEYQMYRQIGIKSAAEFYRRESETMGISSSSARDYTTRGAMFLKYRQDFLEGMDGTPGVSLDDFIKLHMSKLTMYGRAVEKFGREGALIRLKQLNFREFKQELVVNKPAHQHHLKQTAEKTLSSISVHDDQKAMIRGLNLAPNEKRALHIIVRGSQYYPIKDFSEDQVMEVEKRLRQKRVDNLESGLKMVLNRCPRKAYNPDDPLAISEDLYDLRNINDVVLRIRSGLSLAMPARRTIAILVNRLYFERMTFKNQWNTFYNGVEYTSFRDFAMQELGMGEDYRDYIKIGQVLMDYYYFLDGLSDMDTEAVFLKLRYLPKALNTHKGDEPLVLARLRSLTVREFKVFSEEPDFEITFSKRLTKKQLAKFNELLSCVRNPHAPLYQSDIIELYDKTEYGWVCAIERNILAESRKGQDSSEHPLITPEDAKEENLISENAADSSLVA